MNPTTLLQRDVIESRKDQSPFIPRPSHLSAATSNLRVPWRGPSKFRAARAAHDPRGNQQPIANEQQQLSLGKYNRLDAIHETCRSSLPRHPFLVCLRGGTTIVCEGQRRESALLLGSRENRSIETSREDEPLVILRQIRATRRKKNARAGGT